jgi:hypothetical protein
MSIVIRGIEVQDLGGIRKVGADWESVSYAATLNFSTTRMTYKFGKVIVRMSIFGEMGLYKSGPAASPTLRLSHRDGHAESSLGYSSSPMIRRPRRLGEPAYGQAERVRVTDPHGQS